MSQEKDLSKELFLNRKIKSSKSMYFIVIQNNTFFKLYFEKFEYKKKFYYTKHNVNLESYYKFLFMHF